MTVEVQEVVTLLLLITTLGSILHVNDVRRKTQGYLSGLDVLLAGGIWAIINLVLWLVYFVIY